jgi:hypothetical protein
LPVLEAAMEKGDETAAPQEEFLNIYFLSITGKCR